MSNMELATLNPFVKKMASDIVKQLAEKEFTISEAKEIIETTKVYLDKCKFTTIS